jgi:diketogulonate reductase-like aldo/keto reductase
MAFKSCGLEIEENISLFDFELKDNEMHRINALYLNEKHDWY